MECLADRYSTAWRALSQPVRCSAGLSAGGYRAHYVRPCPCRLDGFDDLHVDQLIPIDEQDPRGDDPKKKEIEKFEDDDNDN